MTRKATTLPFTELEVADGNFDTSRANIDRVVIHTMVGSAESAASRFDTYGTQVSAHYGVKLDGTLIHWLEETSTAYHAGNYFMNQRSIGIEHEDNGDYNGTRPDVLYIESAKLVHDICTFYAIPIDRQHILKHSEVIPTGCPDALDIDRIVREAATLNVVMVTIPQAEVDQLRNDRDSNWNKYQDTLKQLDACQTKVSTTVVQVPIELAPTETSATNPLPTKSTVITSPIDVPNNPPSSSNPTSWLNNFIKWLTGK